MLSNPDDITIAALTRLRMSEDYQVLLDYFKRELAKTDQDNRIVKEEVVFRMYQGKASTLAEIIRYSEDANKMLSVRRMNKSANGHGVHNHQQTTSLI